MTGRFSRREILIAGSLGVTGTIGGCLRNNPETETGHIYVENTTNDDHVVALSVTRRTEGTPETVTEGVFEVEVNHALEFEDLLEAGEAYEIRAALVGAPSDNTVWHVVQPCSEGADGRRVVSVRTRADGLGIVPWGCEEDYVKRDLEYVEAEDHRVATVTGTIPRTPQEDGE